MKTIVLRVVIGVIALFLLGGCATIPTTRVDNVLSNDAPTTVVSEKLYNGATPPVFVVGGWNSRDMPLVESFAKGIPGAIAILPERRVPLGTAADTIYLQIVKIMEEKGIAGPIILVAGSWAGLPCRIITAKHPELVMSIITIGTPVGGYPELVNRFLFGAEDDDCEVPLRIIAGFDESLSSFFKPWITGVLNDGLLGLENVTDIGRRKVVDKKIFANVRHLGLFEDPRVTQQVNSWIKEATEEELAKREAAKAILAAVQ